MSDEALATWTNALTNPRRAVYGAQAAREAALMIEGATMTVTEKSARALYDHWRKAHDPLRKIVDIKEWDEAAPALQQVFIDQVQVLSEAGLLVTDDELTARAS